MVTKEICIRQIDADNSILIHQFLKIAQGSLISFRYFEKRSVNVITRHILTAVLLKNGVPIGYGHLDKERERIWLGIAVAESHHGEGFGKLLMNFLLKKGHEKGIRTIYLTVDKNNIPAINMYQKNSFVYVEDINEESVLMKRVTE